LLLLPRIDAAIAHTVDVHATYARLLPRVQGVTTVGAASRSGHGCQYVSVVIDESIYGLARDHLYRLLWHENVLARRYFYPGCHRMAPYQNARRGTMTVTERIADTILNLPAGPHVRCEDAVRIVGLLHAARQHADEVRVWIETG
jgi:dTDP-4-amino-4,6-dideoxygalactose transaminase